MSGYRIAIVGATGLVGQTLLQVLEDTGVPVATLVALAREGEGRFVEFGQDRIAVEPLERMDWGRVDVAFFAAGNAVSAQYAPQATQAGVTVIDKSSYWRMDPHVPLVVPEVNGAAIGDSLLIASPNCSTIQLVIALAPIQARFGVKRVVVSTYQAVSGTGRDAVEELEQQTRAQVSGGSVSPEVYPVTIAHNVLPWCDRFGEADYTGEEWKLMRETEKIMGQNLRLSATAVRVPVYVGHAESVYLETEQPWSLEEIREALKTGPSVRIVDDPVHGAVPTPLDAAGQDDVLVGRIRADLHESRGLHLFVVADNLRRGAASNAVDIMRFIGTRRNQDIPAR
ncbi:MAG: aspartate-semialdehyde dehydrogenase [Sulfobacillus acidophilus]|uniref:Aspartate-semialdehyde dehydrogenase n=1 Tax=Sulfobacillus acidophilus TaxID=53633 RepID=A0A2T2WNG0_9FIRM|nr:MAG: aspartate-semialdehyde dehydrogenase [Sulfobacillus acidophilus]